MAWVTKVTAGYESGYSTEAHNMEDEWPPVFGDVTFNMTGNLMAGNGARDTSVIVNLNNPASWRCGWWMGTGGPGFDHPIVLYIRDASNVSELSIDFSSGLLKMNSDGVILDYIHETCTPICMGQNYWNHYGFMYNSDVCSFYINGKRYLTSAHAVFDCDELWLLATGFTGSSYHTDDFYLQTSDANETDLAPPALRFYPIFPQQTIQSEWSKYPEHLTDSLDAFENFTPDDDGTYLFSPGGSQRERFKFGNVPMAIPDVHVIRNVTIQAAAKDLGVGGIKFFADNGTDEELSSIKDTETEYGGEAQFVMDVDPSGDPWTLDSVSQAEYGIES